MAHTNNPSSNIDAVGIILPPLSAKLTELNSPPITKKNKNILTIERLIGLRISEGPGGLRDLRAGHQHSLRGPRDHSAGASPAHRA